MSSVYDWVSLAIFAGLVVLFLQRATADRAEEDVSLLYYLVASVGCAAGDYLGNHDQSVMGALVLAATVAFILFYLRPIKLNRGS